MSLGSDSLSQPEIVSDSDSYVDSELTLTESSKSSWPWYTCTVCPSPSLSVSSAEPDQTSDLTGRVSSRQPGPGAGFVPLVVSSWPDIGCLRVDRWLTVTDIVARSRLHCFGKAHLSYGSYHVPVCTRAHKGPDSDTLANALWTWIPSVPVTIIAHDRDPPPWPAGSVRQHVWFPSSWTVKSSLSTMSRISASVLAASTCIVPSGWGWCMVQKLLILTCTLCVPLAVQAQCWWSIIPLPISVRKLEL